MQGTAALNECENHCEIHILELYDLAHFSIQVMMLQHLDIDASAFANSELQAQNCSLDLRPFLMRA